jgi:hypothetical protein
MCERGNGVAGGMWDVDLSIAVSFQWEPQALQGYIYALITK